MAQEVTDWGSIGGKAAGGNGGGKKFIKFEAGKSKNLRLIGRAVTFYKFFVRTANGPRSVVVDPEYKGEAAARLSAALGTEVKPGLRYAINCIDREDQQIKILEGGSRIFEHFANWSNGHGGAPPGGSEGWDWMIAARGEGLNREYITTPMTPAPLTEQELHRIKELKEIFTLREVFEGCPPEEVVDRATGDRSSSGPEPVAPRAQPPAEVVSAMSGGAKEVLDF